jgi:hypothetical protein
MYTKTIIPETRSITLDLPLSFIGEHVRVIAVVEKEAPISGKKRRDQIAKTYSVYPKTDLSQFKFNRDEANDFE